MKKIVQTYGHMIKLTVGIIIAVIGCNFFIIPTGISAGGVTGIATILNDLTGWSIAITVLIVNIALLLITFLLVGKEIFLKSIYGSILFPILMGVIPRISVAGDDTLLAVIVGGAFLGVGYAMIFMSGGSTGGTSLIPFILKKYFKLSLTTGFLICDAVSVGANMLVGQYSGIFYGVIAIILTKLIADYLESGLQKRKSLYIISNHSNEIQQFIQNEIQRGTTMISGVGGFTQKRKDIIWSVVSTSEFYLIKEQVVAIDPQAFIIIGNVAEVYGEGFTHDYNLESEKHELEYITNT